MPLGLFSLALQAQVGFLAFLLLALTSLFEGVALAHSLRQESCPLRGVINGEADMAIQYLDAVPI
ncbi:hypothetical protein BX264_2340 [Streptomyces sp. 2333.5]|nr:hypothetical protein BX264_2340 [Streptomyces sp. 2333.5]SEC91761.1 hypothetical protein SAMN05428943_2479 [Streptomyces sp. 2314.4]